MKRKGILLLGAMGISLLFSTLFYSCESNQELAYTGRWIYVDSTLFYTKDSLLRKTTIDLGESSYSIVFSSINDTAKAYIDSMKIKGDLNVRAEALSMRVKEFSVTTDTAKHLITFKSVVDTAFKRVSVKYKIDTMPTFRFRVVNSKLLLRKDGTKDVYYYRE